MSCHGPKIALRGIDVPKTGAGLEIEYPVDTPGPAIVDV